ncbi:hypothetical protein GOP47_0021528 [Adiantum capillus-veneris]|uniref:Cyanovirin-N domain-containing protein n=1 Tax=Adiantum capillus-veneris TaxID=13818 RepID=A0A9D4Z7Y7_ADICA|nr:hypothetical protein GOP47_0021528 [Adiantum capillus-veneris]
MTAARKMLLVAHVALLVALALVNGGDACHWQAGDYSDTCQNVQLSKSGEWLKAYCYSKGWGPDTAGWKWSYLYLNDKLANTNGQLVCRNCNSGFLNMFATRCEFGHSCMDITMKGTHLSAKCLKRDGSRVDTSINLNRCIRDTNGKLKWLCGNALGKKDHPPDNDFVPKVEDSFEKGLQGASKENDDQFIATDKTCLSNVHNSSTFKLLDLDAEQEKENVHAHEDQGHHEDKVPSIRFNMEMREASPRRPLPTLLLTFNFVTSLRGYKESNRTLCGLPSEGLYVASSGVSLHWFDHHREP